MGTVTTSSTQAELHQRQHHLLQLRWELDRIGLRTRLRKPRNGRWKLTLHTQGWSEIVLCAGAEDTYAYVTVHGRILGSASDVRHIARVLAWMIEGRRR